MSQLVKKFEFILLVLYWFDSVQHMDEEGTTTHTLEDLVVDPPTHGSGVMAGAPRAGMYIMAVDIAASSKAMATGSDPRTWGIHNAANPPQSARSLRRTHHRSGSLQLKPKKKQRTPD